jgi:hypothetical protein
MDGWILEDGDESPAREPRIQPNVLPVSNGKDKIGERKNLKRENW